MPPSGDIAGYCYGDAVLFAKVFLRRDMRSIPDMFSDYEALRRPVIDKYYKEATFQSTSANNDLSWIYGIFMEWVTAMFLTVSKWFQGSQIAHDVRNLQLPK